MHINGIKTKASAIAAVNDAKLPALPEKGTDEQKAAVQREIDLCNAVKEFCIKRINAVPDSVEVIGIDIISETGPLEAISIRINQHK